MARFSYAVGRLIASQADVLSSPHGYSGNSSKRLLVFCHGAGELAKNMLDWPGSTNSLAFKQTLAAQFPMVTADLGLPNQGGTSDANNWGNTNAVAWLDSVITQAQSNLGTKGDPVLLVGQSMGTVTALNYYKAHPSRVAAICTILSLVDVDDVRDNNRLGLRAGISAAWGTGTWTAPGTPALPAGANPARNTSSFTGVPIRMYYSTGDTVAIPGAVTTFAAAVGSNVTPVIAGNFDHSDAAVGNVPAGDVLAFLFRFA